MRTRPVRVLHSMPAPGQETRYATHMAATAGDGVEVAFFSWARALGGRYDVFHLHWPEHLIGAGRSPQARVRLLLVVALLVRLTLLRTPVVRTLHNEVPHDTSYAGTRRYRWLGGWFDRRTRATIHLVPDTVGPAGAVDVHIPHGDYREAFARHRTGAAVVPGRVLFFGLLKQYKGIERLTELFAGGEPALGGLSLRVVGNPVDAEVADVVRAADATVERVSTRFGFLADADLVAEVEQAELVVLPYDELHSSGVVIVTLSLDTPVLVPDGETGRALLEEAGNGWVSLFSAPLTAADVRAAYDAVRAADRPDLAERSWDVVRRRHHEVYDRVLA